jgi:VCBS repeat-containing protein
VTATSNNTSLIPNPVVTYTSPAGTGSLSFTPVANANGSATITVTVQDNGGTLQGGADTTSRTFNVNVSAVNDPPVAVNDSYAVSGNSTLTVSAPGLLANDADVEGNQLTATLVTNPSNGALSLNTDGSFTYTPAANASGTDSFTYRATDGQLSSDVATVQLTVTAAPTTVEFQSTLYSVQEDCTGIPVTITRAGTLSGTTSVDYLTADGTAGQRADYTLAAGRLTFAPGETTKVITLLVSEDSFTEGGEFFTISLGNVSGGSPGAVTTATVQIVDDPVEPATNAINQTSIFVCQHYHDFLNREPEPGGFQGWQDILNNCAQGDSKCDRVEVSSAFYRSDEFQQRGFFLYRFYVAALGRTPRYLEFMAALSLTTGFLTDQQIEAGKAVFVQEFMNLQEFRDKYDSLTAPAAYVDALEQTAGVTLANRQQLIDDLAAGRKTRGEVLRSIAESSEVRARYFNQAFVVMQYFGYLRRDPDILYLDWIQTLNQTGDYRVLVNGFVNSLEYRSRFGQP